MYDIYYINATALNSFIFTFTSTSGLVLGVQTMDKGQVGIENLRLLATFGNSTYNITSRAVDITVNIILTCRDSDVY